MPSYKGNASGVRFFARGRVHRGTPHYTSKGPPRSSLDLEESTPNNGSQSRHLARRNLTSIRGSKKKGVYRFVPVGMIQHLVPPGMSGNFRLRKPIG